MDIMYWTVQETVRAAPPARRVFTGLGIDCRRDATLTLGEAAGRAGLTLDALAAALRPAIAAAC